MKTDIIIFSEGLAPLLKSWMTECSGSPITIGRTEITREVVAVSGDLTDEDLWKLYHAAEETLVAVYVDNE